MGIYEDVSGSQDSTTRRYAQQSTVLVTREIQVRFEKSGSASICGGSDTVIETNHLYPSSNGMPPLWTRKGA